MGEEPLTGVELALYEHFRYLDCGQVVDPTDPDDCANMAVEVIRFMRAAGWVPLADVLDALEEEGRLAAWRLTPDAADVYSRAMTMLAERFAPTAPEDRT
jgi:hypothetical protein